MWSEASPSQSWQQQHNFHNDIRAWPVIGCRLKCTTQSFLFQAHCCLYSHRHYMFFFYSKYFMSIWLHHLAWRKSDSDPECYTCCLQHRRRATVSRALGQQQTLFCFGALHSVKKDFQIIQVSSWPCKKTIIGNKHIWKRPAFLWQVHHLGGRFCYFPNFI